MMMKPRTVRTHEKSNAAKSNSSFKKSELPCEEIPDWVYRRIDAPAEVNDGNLVQRIASRLQARLGKQVHDFQMLAFPDGLILQGVVGNYYGKQLAQEIAAELSGLSVLSNDIEVRCVDLSQDSTIHRLIFLT